MRVLVSGSTGLIGRALCASLNTQGHEVWTLVRRSPRDSAQEIEWPAPAAPVRPELLEGFDVVVHLAGENIASGRWTTRRRARLRSSRVDATVALVEALTHRKRPPSVIVCASAVGAYGDTGDAFVHEDTPRGQGFLADLVRDWEEATDGARAAGIRVVNARTGVVLSSDGGALSKMLPAFRWGLGARLGDGQQWMSWISRRDVVSAIEYAIGRADLVGPVNLVAGAVTNADFTRSLGRAVARPTPWVAPAFLMRLLAGALAQEVLLTGQRVRADRLSAAGFVFQDRDLTKTLARLTG